MSSAKKNIKKSTKTDTFLTMPKDTPGQRVKYLLKKYGLNQLQFATLFYYGDEALAKTQRGNLNAKLNGNRTITLDDAKRIAEIFPGTFVEFILSGGYENVQDQLAGIINDNQKEAVLLDTAFLSLAKLGGFSIEKFGMASGDIENVISSLHDYTVITSEGNRYSLSLKQVNQLENIICDHAVMSINQFLKFNGKEMKENG